MQLYGGFFVAKEMVDIGQMIVFSDYHKILYCQKW